jgi:NAD(P)-dependent dehydrogenase (short-subunit alcohol dehydrogenase family)
MWVMDKKVAVITGASKGIGKCLAELLVKEGYIVINASKTEPEKEIDGAVFIQTDVRNNSECERMLEKVIEEYGRLDILVNNAGILFPDRVENVDEDQLRSTIETNVYGPFFCTHHAIRHMKKQGSGQIINVSSIAGVLFRPGISSYSTSKWALVGFSGTLRLQVEKDGIDVVCFCPGGIKTELFRNDKERDISDFMEPGYVAGKIFQVMKRKNKDKWLFVCFRGDDKLIEYGFDDFPAIQRT